MFHANGWTFTWIVTAVGGDARLPAQGRSGAQCSELIRDEHITLLCAAPTVLIALANAPAGGARRGARRACAW